ncbi:malonate decarboxylase subunit alpha [Microbacteriaceae bacterium VKM Ac-2855]|nr:malonate decarboxylase subunit alpha [Microbacteriaceae bacterium VKM Ac-2855]
MRISLVSAADAAALIGDGRTVGLDGFTMMGVADEIYAAIQASYSATGSPADLTIVHPAGQSNREVGLERFAEPGLVKRIVGSHWGLAPRLGTLINDDGVEGICLPQGQLSNLLRAIAAGRPGNLSRVGLGTFVDPTLEGGRVNSRARNAVAPTEYVDRLNILGEDFLLYKSFPIDVAIIRATRADRSGNVAQGDEAAGLDALALAQATRNSGGIVLCQVKEIVEIGDIHARDVTVPANLIDHVVLTTDAERYHRQSDSVAQESGLTSGVISAEALTVALEAKPIDPLRLAIGLRGAALVRSGDVINVGTGIPGDTVGPALAELGILPSVTMSIESGVYGGVPMGGTDFGASLHPSAIIGHSAQFDFYTGGGVDIAFMGVGQVAPLGDVNVSKLGGRLIGCGGFIDILSGARRICFLMSARGRHPKFVDVVDHLTFNGQEALANGQEVYLATEDFTLALTEAGWVVHSSVDSDAVRKLLANLPVLPTLEPSTRS